MTEPAPDRPGFRIHPVDLVVLVMALALAALAYAYLFKRSPVPRAVDPLLGVVVEVEFEADRDWKRNFPEVGGEVLLDDYLAAEVLEAGDVPGTEGGRRMARVRIKDREDQKPEAMTLFRTGVFRGTKVRMTGNRSEVQGEVVLVESTEGAR